MKLEDLIDDLLYIFAVIGIVCVILIISIFVVL